MNTSLTNSADNKQKYYQRLGTLSITAGVELFKLIQQHGTIIFGSSGEMGSKISSTFPRATVPIIMQDIDELKLEESKKNVLDTLEKATKKRKLSKKQLEIIKEKNLIKNIIAFPLKGKIPFQEIDKANLESKEKAKQFVSDFLNKSLSSNELREAYQNTFMVLEAGPEVLSFKQNVFNFFELVLNSDKAVLATNTSSLCISDITKKLSNPERVVGFHYFLPAHINPLIEIILSPDTNIEIAQAMQNLAISMGKKPIFCFGDSPGAIANRILVGVLNEAAKIYEGCGFSPATIDKIFLETFYSRQIKIQTKKAKNQFKAAPKLSFFMDEYGLYCEIEKIDQAILKLIKNDSPKLLKQLQIKKEKIEKLEGSLRQKLLYVQIVENLESLGTFFKPAEIITKLKSILQEQTSKVKNYSYECELNPNTLRKSFTVTPYEFPPPKNSSKTYKISKEIVKDRLLGAYIAISQEIFKEGLGTVSDIELACKEGFKWNIGPFELIKELKKEKIEYLTNLINATVSQDTKTGISRASEIVFFGEGNLSGVQSYIQDNVGFIVLGRLHIQNLQLTQNSLNPSMLNTISFILKDLQDKKVKAIIIKSQGGGAFSSGADLDYIDSVNWDKKKLLEFRNLGKKVMGEIENCKVPTISIIDGPAIGGGFELALACDYRIGTDLSFFAFPEIALGIIPDWGGTEKLPKITGKEFAKRLICTANIKNMGLKLSGEDAYNIGILDKYVLQSELPCYLGDLIEGKIPKLNIYTKPQKKENFDRQDFPENIINRFNLNSSFKHSFRIFTKQAARLAEDLINNSHKPEYAKRVNNDEVFLRLTSSGKNISNYCIKPMLMAIQNKLLAPILEIIGIL